MEFSYSLPRLQILEVVFPVIKKGLTYDVCVYDNYKQKTLKTFVFYKQAEKYFDKLSKKKKYKNMFVVFIRDKRILSKGGLIR